MTYDTFRSKYLHLSETIVSAGGCPDPSVAETLCRLAYESLSEELRDNQREVFKKLMELFQERFAPQYASSCDGTIRALYPGKRIHPEILDDMTLDELLDAAYPALCAAPLTRRVVGGLRLLGWHNESIAELFNEALQPLESKLREGIRLQDACEALECFRTNLCDTISELDGKSDWLCPLFKHTNDALCELDTLKTLTELCKRPLAIRCARPSDPDRDRYGWLREQWRPLAEAIRSVVEEMDTEP